MALTIKTNNTPRDVIYWYELSEKERKEFDYLDSETRQLDASFFRYRGAVYDLGEFARIIAPGARICHPMECANPDFQGWDGYLSDSFFSGILIKWRDDYERVIVGLYFS